jgi:hypothetical protein
LDSWLPGQVALPDGRDQGMEPVGRDPTGDQRVAEALLGRSEPGARGPGLLGRAASRQLLRNYWEAIKRVRRTRLTGHLGW